METITSQQLTDAFMKLQKAKHENPEKFRGFRTGLPDLDKILGGLHKGWYVVVGGPQKGGKSAFMVTLATSFGVAGIKFMWVGLEMSNMQMAERVFSNMTGVPMTKFRDIDLKQEDWRQLESGKVRIDKFNGVWNYGAYRVEEIMDLTQEHDPDVVFVDYFQLMSGDDKGGYRSRTQEMEEISRKLKQITIGGKRDRLVVVAAQINREGQKAQAWDSPLIFSQTSSLEKDADVAMVLAPDVDPTGRESPEYRQLKIVASRHSETASYRVRFIGARSLIGGAEQKIDLDKVAKERLERQYKKDDPENPW